MIAIAEKAGDALQRSIVFTKLSVDRLSERLALAMMPDSNDDLLRKVLACKEAEQSRFNGLRLSKFVEAALA